MLHQGENVGYKRYETRNEKISQYWKKDAEGEEAKKDSMLYVIGMQLIIFSIMFLVFFLIGKVNPTGFAALQNAYQTIFQKEIGKEEFAETFQTVKETFAKMQKKEDEEQNMDIYNGQGGEDIPFCGKKASFAPITVTAKFYKPVDYQRVSSPFGYREHPISHKKGFHTGVDLAAPTGTPICAAFHGIVKTVSESNTRGKYLVLEHGKGLETIYCHCDAILVTEGQNIHGGEKIALVGSTGQTTGPHLHFEVKLNGYFYNPFWLLNNEF